jgi:hypothetical protein
VIQWIRVPGYDVHRELDVGGVAVLFADVGVPPEVAATRIGSVVAGVFLSVALVWGGLKAVRWEARSRTTLGRMAAWALLLLGSLAMVCTVFLVLLVGALVFTASSPPEKRPKPEPQLPRWPALSEVTRVTASVSGRVTGEPDLATFELADEFVPGVLRVLTPPERHKHPRGVQEVGWLHVYLHKGPVLEVQLHDKYLFTLDGVQCIRGGTDKDLLEKSYTLEEGPVFERLLRAAHRGDRAGVRNCLELLHPPSK